MACRHDHLLMFENVEQSGEKCVLIINIVFPSVQPVELILGHRSYYALSLMKWLLDIFGEADSPHRRVGFLYDIG